MDARYRIRPARNADAMPLAEIERRCFSDPWSMAGIEETIQHGTTLGFVAELSGRVTGYLMIRTSGEEGEILNLAVLPEHRRRGIARELLARGIAALRSQGVTEAYLEVRESNQAAISLYGANGFTPVGMRPHYYRSPPEDALVLRVQISPMRD